MSYQVEKLEKSMVKLTIEVNAEDFEKAMQKSYNKNKGKLSLQGFRKGKAPRKMIEKMYGPEIFYEDAANYLIEDAYEEAVKDSQLDIVSQPEIEIVDIGKGKPFIFGAVVAIKPEVILGRYKGLEVEKQDIEVTEEEVDEEIDKVREQNARIITVDTRAIETNDVAIIDYEGFADGEAFEGGSGQNYELTIGSHFFIDTFEDQLIGKKAGDELDVNVTFPEDYHAENLKGKPALFQVKIHEVRTKEIPDADDDFASEVSEFDTLEEYKTDIKNALKEKRKERAGTAKEEAVVELAVKNAQMEVPEPMIQEQVRQMINEFALRIQQQGIQFEQYMKMTGMDSAMLMEQMKPEAIRRIESRLVLEEIAKIEEIQALEEDIENEIENMALMYRLEIEKFKETLRDEDRKNIEQDMKVKRAVELIVAEAVEVESKPEETIE